MDRRSISRHLINHLGNYSRLAAAGRRITALVLIVAFLLPISVPASQLSRGTDTATSGISVLAFALNYVSATLSMIFGSAPAQRNSTMPSGVETPHSPPRRPATKEEREAKVASIRLSTASEIRLQEEQQLILGALPVDTDGNIIQGLFVEWESNNSEIVSVTPDGLVTAVSPGTATIVAHAGNKRETVRVTVAGGKWNFGGVKPDSVKAEVSRSEKLSTAPSTLAETQTASAQKDSAPKDKASMDVRLAHPVKKIRAALAAPLMPIPPAGEGPLEDAETSSLYKSENIVGKPKGRTEAATIAAAATGEGAETTGNSNYTFNVPIVSLPGRGISLSLGLFYNSRLWNKSQTRVFGVDKTKMTFDVDSGWPAAGFRLGYGQLESQGASVGYTLTDPDGTRHEMVRTNPDGSDFTNYDTKDGTFIHFTGGQAGGTATYPDGTQVMFGAPNGPRIFPTRITDRNGNFISIHYVTNQNNIEVGPNIAYVEDTLGRRVEFVYSSSNPNELVEIKAPEYGKEPNDPTRTIARFYYETVSLSGTFASGTVVSSPTSIRALRYIYFKGSQTGYRYDYSPYGMIRVINQLRKMQVDATTNALTGEGQRVAWTTYTYPEYYEDLQGVPTFGARIDDWSGRTSPLPAYGFTVARDEAQQESVSTVTDPDGVSTKTYSYYATDSWKDGLVKKVIVEWRGHERSKVTYEWDHRTVNGVFRDPKLNWIKISNDVAGQTRSIVYSDYDEYNNPGTVSERDFAAEDSLGTELRKTVTTYYHATNPGYAERGLVHLPKSVKVYKGGAPVNEPSSWVDYVYDGVTPTPRTNVQGYTNPGANAARGNVTSVTAYANAKGKAEGMTSDATTNTMSYDELGNVVQETVNCCNLKKFTYSSAHQYAYVVIVERGDTQQLKTEATYDFNTGLVRTTKDENDQVTTEDYDLYNYPNWHKTTRPDGGYTETFNYINLDYDDPAPTTKHSTVFSRTYLGGGEGTESNFTRQWQFMDGRGAVVRSFMQTGAFNTSEHQVATDTQYDIMGRVLKTTAPYYVPTGSPDPIPQDAKWITYGAYDWAGRPGWVQLQDGTYMEWVYSGRVTTVKDQASRQRRQITDALGRIKEVVEPGEASGNVDSAGSFSTTYQYDALDNLTKITQGDQVREFKYDSLGHLIRQRQVEALAVYDDNGLYVGSNSADAKWSDVFTYNDKGKLTDAYDARQVHTEFQYNDSLNRLTDILYSDDTPDVKYTYDTNRSTQDQTFYNAGRLTEVATLVGGAKQTIQAYDYDLMGNVVRQQQSVGGGDPYTLSYGYGKAGQLLSETYPSGKQVQYEYDQALRLKSVTNGGNQTYADTYQYYAHGGLKSETLGNNTVQSYTYNNRLQLEQIKLAKGTQVLQQYDYKYGEVDQTTGAVDANRNTGQIVAIEGRIGATLQWQQRFTYDTLGRLKQASERLGSDLTSLPTYKQVYSYDRFGNRYQKAAENPTIDANQDPTQTHPQPFKAVEEGDIDTLTNRFKQSTTGIQYDAAGNVTADPKFQGKQFRYDANGRMVKVLSLDEPAVTQAESVYDGLGQRVQVTEGGVTRKQVYDIFGQLVAEYGGTLTSGDPGGIKYLMIDHEGSTRVVMNGSGGVIKRRDYRAFGEDIGANVGMRTTAQGYDSTEGTRQQYADMEKDQSGLDHTDWRKYDSTAGRWTSPDPLTGSIGNPQSFNRYSYVQNDPVNLVDPSGLVPCWGAECGWGAVSAGFWGGGDLNNRPRNTGREIIREAWESTEIQIWTIFNRALFIETEGRRGGQQFYVSSIFQQFSDLDDNQLRLLNLAISEAINILRDRPECADFINGDRRVNTLKYFMNSGVINELRSSFQPSLDQPAYTYENGRIGLGVSFFSPPELRDQMAWSFDIAKMPNPNLSLNESRAMIILHELRHRITNLKHTTNNSYGYEVRELYNNCFGWKKGGK